jgi:hypothetical protein
MISLYIVLFNEPTPRFAQEARNNIKEIGDWFLDDNFSYIRIYGCAVTPHLLPKYVRDRLVLRDIAFQIVSTRITRSLFSNSNELWPLFL